MQTLPDGFFAETGVNWDAGFGTVHAQRITAPERTGLYYFHATGESGAFFSFPLVVAPKKPTSSIAVIASTNTWNAYNAFGGRSNYIMAARMIEEPIVNSKSDLPHYKMKEYGEWTSEKSLSRSPSIVRSLTTTSRKRCNVPTRSRVGRPAILLPQSGGSWAGWNARAILTISTPIPNSIMAISIWTLTRC